MAFLAIFEEESLFPKATDKTFAEKLMTNMLGKLGPFSKHVGHQLLSKGFVSCFWEKGLLFKDGKESHWLLKHINTLLKIHAKINISPVKTFLNILLLLKGKHVLIKELLQLLIDIIDANLFKAVVVKNFEPCDVKDTNIGDLLHGWIAKGFITFVDNKAEGTFIDATSNTRDRACSLGTGRALLHPLGTNLQFWL